MTKDEVTEFGVYVSDSSLRTAAKAIEFVGKKAVEVIDQLADELAKEKELTPSEAKKAKKLVKALDKGEISYSDFGDCVDGGTCEFELANGEKVEASEEEVGKILEITIYVSYNGAELSPNEKSINDIANILRGIDNKYGKDGKSATQLLAVYGEFLGAARSAIIREKLGDGVGDFHDQGTELIGELSTDLIKKLNGYIDQKAQERGWSQSYTNDLKYIVGVGGTVIGSVVGKKGGAHRDTSKPRNDGLDSHHCPAKNCYKGAPISSSSGPAVKMEPSDHSKTASYGSGKAAKEYRERQRKLLDQGKLDEAIKMDIDDIRSKFGNKYDDAIKQMKDYAKTLNPEDFINK